MWRGRTHWPALQALFSRVPEIPILPSAHARRQHAAAEGSLIINSIFPGCTKANIHVVLAAVGDVLSSWNFRSTLGWSSSTVCWRLSRRSCRKIGSAGHLRAAWDRWASYCVIKLLSSFKQSELAHDYLKCGLTLPAVTVLLGICELLK